MLLKTGRFVVILLSAIALSAAPAHLMELPGKLTDDGPLYGLLHRTLYPTFGQTAGWAEGFSLIGSTALVWLVRKRGAAFMLTAAAAACQIAAMAVFLLLVQPANTTMAAWLLDAIPADWTRWRDQWEYAHAARAVLQVSGLALLVLSVIKETPADDPQAVARERGTSPRGSSAAGGRWAAPS